MKIYLLYPLIALTVRNILLGLRKFEEKENGRVAFWMKNTYLIIANEDLFIVPSNSTSSM